MKYNIQSRTHDGRQFYWTREAIKHLKGQSETIGFYFDDLGFPQEIKRGSLYGSHILRWHKESLVNPRFPIYPKDKSK